MLFQVPRRLASLFLGAARSLTGRTPLQAVPPAGDARLTFLNTLPPEPRAIVVDDIKLLIGWVAEAASMPDAPSVGQVVDATSTFAKVPGFTSPTDLKGLAATYRLAMPPLIGPGYFGLTLALTGKDGQAVALLLINRLFRLPIILHEPLGVLTDIVTVGALLIGTPSPAVRAATMAAKAAYRLAREFGVPLIATGQSLAGGLAQYQVATLVDAGLPMAGFITFNAAHVAASIERLGLEPEHIPGINFSKDLDPGVGPRSLLPNRVGIQVYVRLDGTASLCPGPYSLLSALLHPWEHLLRSFNQVRLGGALNELHLLAKN